MSAPQEQDLLTPERPPLTKSRKVAIAVFVAIFVAFAAYRYHHFAQTVLSQPSTPDTSSPQEDRTPPQPSQAKTNDQHPASQTADVRPLTSTDDQEDRDSTQSSWIDPFKQSLWTSDSWSFSEKAMVAIQKNSNARFRRSYQNLMVSCTLHAESETPDFRISIQPNDNSKALEVSIQPESISLIERHDGKTTKLAERSMEKSPFEAGAAEVRTVITANRILVGCNEAIVINTTRPLDFTNTEIRFGLSANHVGAKIDRLRIEGE